LCKHPEYPKLNERKTLVQLNGVKNEGKAAEDEEQS
jgi:hypothetical protein